MARWADTCLGCPLPFAVDKEADLTSALSPEGEGVVLVGSATLRAPVQAGGNLFNRRAVWLVLDAFNRLAGFHFPFLHYE